MGTECIRENRHGTISCDEYEVLDIIRARYGRISPLEKGCDEENDWTCVAGNSLEVVRTACQQKRTCELLPHKNTFLTDPCPGHLKFLEVQYNCQSITTTTRRTGAAKNATIATVTASTEFLRTVRPTGGISPTIAKSSTGTGVIVGMAAGGLLALLMITLIVIFVLRRRKPRDKQKRATSEIRQNEVYEMNAGFVGNGTNADGRNATYYSTVTKEPDQLVGDNDYQSADNVYSYVDQDKEIGRGNGKMTENILYGIR